MSRFADSIATLYTKLANGGTLTSAVLYDAGIEIAGNLARAAMARVRAIYAEDITFTANATTDQCTAADHMLAQDQQVMLTTTNTLPAPLATDTVYYVEGPDSDAGTFQLAATQGGAAINITTTGTGVHTVQAIGADRILVADPGYGGNPRTITAALGGVALPTCDSTSYTGGASVSAFVPSTSVIFLGTPTANRAVTLDDTNSTNLQEVTIMRPNTGAFTWTVTRQGTGDSMATLTASKHTSVKLKHLGGRWRVLMLGVDATIGIDP